MELLFIIVFVGIIVLIITAFGRDVLRLRRNQRQRTHKDTIVANPSTEPINNAFPPATIKLIHASDAQQYIRELKSILSRMKADHRISDFTAYDISINQNNIDYKDEDCQGILVMLTNELGQVRNEIENALKDITQKNSNIKLIEIIIDNLPYHNDFISLPEDLLPIRSRPNMNLVWAGIERDLHAMFPMPTEPEPPPPPPPEKRAHLLRGIVKGFQQRSEIERFYNKHKVVWSFRIDCYDNGKLINTIPVQMVGERFKGSINDGDDVEVFRWRKGTVLETDRIKNWTTGIEVRSSSGSVLQALGWLIFLLGIGFIIFLMATGMRR
jgi:hypothetical protein